MTPGRSRLLTPRPAVGVWYRAVRVIHFRTTLSFAHTASIPSRFNPGHPRTGFPILYLTEDPITALFEVNAVLGGPLPNSAFVPNPSIHAGNQHWVPVQVDVQLTRIADLTLASQRRIVDTSAQELTGDWRGYTLRNPTPRVAAPYFTNVPTQRLGVGLFRVRGLEGFLTYSARNPVRRNLVVFPTKVRKGNWVRFTDPTTGTVYSIP